MKYIILSTSLLALIFASGCQDNRGLSEDFGNAVYQNEAIHILPPKYADNKNTSIQGDRGALTFQRYKTGNTIAPSSGGSGFSIGSGGGGN